MDISRINNGIIKNNQNVFSKNQVSDNRQFSSVLKGYLENVDETIKQASSLSEKTAAGEITNIHDVAIASQKAKLALELTVAVRDKAVESYQEIMRMQI